MDELREQLVVVRAEQLAVAWENYVHERFRELDTVARRRQKHVVLDLPGGSRPVPVNRLPELSVRLAAAYAGKGPKTLTRDVNELSALGLVRRERGGVVANRDIMEAFLPVRVGG